MTQFTDPLSAEASTTPPTITCRSCELTSTLLELFHKRQCPQCVANTNINILKGIYIILFMLLFGDILFNGFSLNLRRFPQTLAAFVVLSLIANIAHELSHATVARLLNGRVFGIQIGTGTPFFKKCFGDFLFIFRTLPTGGLCYAGFYESSWFRLRHFVYASAGLVFHLLVIVLIAPRLGPIFATQLDTLLWYVVVVNVWKLLSNLIPGTVNSAIGSIDNDGRQMLNVITGKTKAGILKESFHFTASLFAYERNDMDAFHTHTEEGLTLFPDSTALRYMHLIQLLEDDKFLKAHNFWEDAIEPQLGDMDGATRAGLFAIKAWIELLREPTKSTFASAYDFAERAYTMTPWVPSIAGTFGCFVIVSGESVEGSALVQTAIDDLEQTKPARWQNHLGTYLGALALANFRLEQFETVQPLLDKAHALSPDDMWLALVSAEIKLPQ